jgi:drug/metabolite transporter (DMT)-like permease
MKALSILSAGGRTLPIWTLLVVFETLAQVAMRLGGESLADVPPGLAWATAALTDPWLVLGIVGYIGSFLAWMVILDRLPLSLGFPLTSVVVLAVTAASIVVLGETLTLLHGAGIALIVVGIVMMGRDDT